jgi:hypothetical protein
MRRFRHAPVEIPPEGEKRNGVSACGRNVSAYGRVGVSAYGEKRNGVSAYRRNGVWGERNSAWNTETKDIETRQSFPLCFFRAGQSATLRLMLVVSAPTRPIRRFVFPGTPTRRRAHTPIRRHAVSFLPHADTPFRFSTPRLLQVRRRTTVATIQRG